MRVVSGLYFFPRGGSSHVARALAGALPEDGWDVTLLSGSLGTGHGDARAFYAGLDVHAADIVDPGRTGWLVEPDDEAGLADAIVAAVDDGEERARRGIAARRVGRETWSWPALARRVSGVLEEATGVGDASRTGSPGA